MSETQVVSSRGKFPLQLWTCATRQFMCFQNTMLGRYRKSIPISNGRSIKKEEMKSPKQIQDLAGHIPLYVDLRIILFGSMPTFWAYGGGNLNPKTPGSPVPTALVKGHVACWNWGESLILKLRRQPWWFLNQLQSHSSLSWRIVHVCSQRAPWSGLMGYKKSDGLISFFSVLFSPSWKCFSWYNPISIPSFCWDCWWSLWVTLMNLSNDCSATPLVFSSEKAFSFCVCKHKFSFL